MKISSRFNIAFRTFWLRRRKSRNINTLGILRMMSSSSSKPNTRTSPIRPLTPSSKNPPRNW